MYTMRYFKTTFFSLSIFLFVSIFLTKSSFAKNSNGGSVLMYSPAIELCHQSFQAKGEGSHGRAHSQTIYYTNDPIEKVLAYYQSQNNVVEQIMPTEDSKDEYTFTSKSDRNDSIYLESTSAKKHNLPACKKKAPKTAKTFIMQVSYFGEIPLN